MRTKENKLPTRTLKLAAKAYALSLVINYGSVDEDEATILASMAGAEATKTFFKLFPLEETVPTGPAECVALAQKYTKSIKGKK